MDCFNNTCLSCDRECEGHYCSQACKLADVERGTQGLRTPPSPTSTKTSSSSSKAFQPPQQSPTDMYSSHRRPQSSYFMFNSSMETSHSSKVLERVLTPSSSRASLSSTTSSGTSGNNADLDTQLQDYFSSFDKARAAKRRSSTR